MLTQGTTTADRAALSGVLAGVSFIGGVAVAMSRSKDPYPRPGADAATIRRYFTGNAGPARVSVAGQLLSAAALARFTASVAGLAGRSGAGPAGSSEAGSTGSTGAAGSGGSAGSDRGARALKAMALAGGTLAAASLATSAGHSAALTNAADRTDADVVALARRGFVAGGPVHTAAFGLLLGALGLAGLRGGELPRPLAKAALVSASLSLASPLYFLAEPAGWFIPAGRFSGLLVSGIAGVRLARRC